MVMRTDDFTMVCEGETICRGEMTPYGMSVEEKLMSLLWYVCGGEMTVVRWNGSCDHAKSRANSRKYASIARA